MTNENQSSEREEEKEKRKGKGERASLNDATSSSMQTEADLFTAFRM